MAILEDLYPSRIGEQPRVLDRKDPVIWPGRERPEHLSAEQAAAYERDGFLMIEDVFTDEEVDAFRTELRRMAASEEIQKLDEAVAEPDSGAVRSIFRVHQLSEVFARLCRDPRVLEIARFLLGDDVYIHQSRVNLKPGFQGKEFYWHSDFETWHVEDGMPRMRAVSASIALTDNNEFNGPLMLIPGSHRDFVACVGKTPENNYKSSLRRQEIGVPDPESLTALADQGGIVAPKGKAGSVVFFECNTMHGSNSNISPYPRSNAFFVFNAISNKVVEPFCGLTPRPEHIAARDKIEIL